MSPASLGAAVATAARPCRVRAACLLPQAADPVQQDALALDIDIDLHLQLEDFLGSGLRVDLAAAGAGVCQKAKINTGR